MPGMHADRRPLKICWIGVSWGPGHAKALKNGNAQNVSFKSRGEVWQQCHKASSDRLLCPEKNGHLLDMLIPFFFHLGRSRNMCCNSPLFGPLFDEGSSEWTCGRTTVLLGLTLSVGASAIAM